ncbi:MAG: tandem-95 repeat protein [Novosphingobium sp.]|nr:tandem-95 repeat protein [Novosphingobium sp.]
MTKHVKDQQPAKSEQDVDGKDADEANAVQAKEADQHHASMSDVPLSGDFSFAGALAAAAGGTAELVSETAESSAQGDDSYGDDDDGMGGTLLLVGAVGLVGLGIAVLAGGGGNKNDAPTVSADSQTLTVAEDTPGNVTISASDPDGDPLTYTVSTSPTNGTVTAGTGGTFTYTPATDFNGTDSFVVTVSDGEFSVTQTINVTVTPVNDAPKPDAENTSSLTIDEDTTGTIIIAYTDPEGDAVTGTITSDVQHGTLTENADGTYTYTPDADYNGTDSLSYTITDGTDSVDVTVPITINPVNDDPDFGADSADISLEENTVFSGSVSAADVDGDDLTYSLGDAASNGDAVVNEDGTYTYTPDTDFSGTDSYTVLVSDGNGGTDELTVNVTVDPAVELVSIDVVGPNSTTPATVSGDAGETVFTDNSTENTDVFITDFGTDDVIEVSNATSDDYSFSTGPNDPNDLYITYTNTDAGTSNLILIDDILAGSSGFITDYDSAVAAVGFTFMTFG